MSTDNNQQEKADGLECLAVSVNKAKPVLENVSDERLREIAMLSKVGVGRV